MWTGSPAALASRAALWLVCRAAPYTGPELSRKLLHVAMGLILCPLPWMFDRPAPVILLCATYVALLIARCALAREESRGAHFRSDCPGKLPAFEKHSVVSKDAAVTFR